MHFPASNNATEYEALLHGLRITTALGIHRLKVLGDSMLIVNQGNKEWSCLDDKISLYC
jgi:ribonuclease HI